MSSSGPLELSRLLPAFDQGSDEALGLELVAALKRSKARSSVRADVLSPRLVKYPPSVQKAGEALLASLDVDAAKQGQRLEELLTPLQGGDIRRGQAVFNSPKAACMSCHAIGYMGGKIGPISRGSVRFAASVICSKPSSFRAPALYAALSRSS